MIHDSSLFASRQSNNEIVYHFFFVARKEKRNAKVLIRFYGEKIKYRFFSPFRVKGYLLYETWTEKKCKQEIMLEKVEDIDKEHNLKCLHLKI